MSRFLRARYQPMRAYIPGEQPKIDNLIKLNTNENPYPPSPAVRAAITGAQVDKLRLYSDPAARELRNAIASRYGLDAENVSVSNGSDEVLAFCVLAFGADGARFPDITYGFYPVWCELFDVEKEIVPLNDDFSVDADAFRIDDRLSVLANPNAPTGMTLPLDAIERVLRACPNHVLVVDEAYVDFGAESAAALIPKYDNLLVVQTFSKSRALAGGRIGFALGQKPLIEDIEKMRNSFNPYNLNRLSILAGAAAMADEAYFEKTRRMVMATRERAAGSMRDLGFIVLPSKANFLFCAHPKISGKAYMEALRARSILVRYFDIPRIRGFVRITVGTDEQMDALARATREILEGV